MADRGGWRRVPWWLVALAGLVCAVLGAVLVARPFDSLSVLVALVAVGAVATAVSGLTVWWRRTSRWAAPVEALLWLAVALAVVAWPDITVRALALVVGAGLLLGGVLDVVGGIRGTIDERVAAVLGGAAGVVLGVLALSWPSVTVLVVAVVFGARLVWFGLRLAWSSVQDRHGGGPTAVGHPRGRFRRFAHAVGSGVALLVALALAVLSAWLNAGEPSLDAFYDAPEEVPDEPGRLVRAERFTRTMPEEAEAWRILYTTTRADGVPALASALVVVPVDRGDEPLPVIALAHGTTGVARTCAPSVLPDPFGAGAFFALGGVLERSWALVATDYIGLGTAGGHPYLVGQPAGRSVLDSVRAAHELGDVTLADRTVVWGHSQGGGAALWTGGLAPMYAPDVGVVGVAALAPASDLPGLADSLRRVTGGSILAGFIVQGYANAYDDVDVDDYVRRVARPTFDAAVRRCLSEPAVLLSAIGSVVTGESVFSNDPATGPLSERLGENVPVLPVEAPLLVAQGEGDRLISPVVQAAYVQARCEAGQAVDYRTYPGLEHVPLVQADSPLLPELFDWTEQRFAGAPFEPTCGG